MAVSHAFEYTLNGGGFSALKSELDRFDPKLTTALRANLKHIGASAVEEIRKTLEMAPPEGGVSGTDYRQALVGGTHLSVSFGVRSGGVKITTSGAGLDPKHAGLLKVYNMAKFRHPVFESNRQAVTRVFTAKESAKQKKARVASGELANWVQERGRPYFGEAILKVANQRMALEMMAAVDEAVKAIGGREL